MIPPGQNAQFVYHMEDVLDLYTRPLDPLRPLVCMDEMPKQLIGESRQPLPARPGQSERFDYEYVRNGVVNIFCVCEPLLSSREFTVTDRRTRKDWARLIKDLVDIRHPEAQKIILVMGSAQHPLGRQSLRSLRASRGQKTLGQARDPLYSKTRQLAKYRRDRAVGALKAVSRPSDSRH